MKPTEILMAEHRVIELVLDCLEKMVQRLQAGNALDPDDARDAVTFFRNFADRCHHGKEETHLFAMMEERGFPRQGGPTGVMLHEHDLGRSFVRGMDDHIAAAAAGDSGAIAQYIHNATSFFNLLREHIRKEDHCLFAMADQNFSPQDQALLLQRFEQTEHEDMGSGAHHKFLKLAQDLADKYQVSRQHLDLAHAPAGGGCGCHHHQNAG